MAMKTNIQHEVFLIQHITEYMKNNNNISVNPQDLFIMILTLKRLNLQKAGNLSLFV